MMNVSLGSNEKWHKIFLFALALIIGIITLYYHEMWRDESQAFLLVRDSRNLVELWNNVRYEGHPFLWHFILFVAYHVFPSIYIIQIVHIAIALCVIGVIVFYSPFSFFQKFLLCFSYYFSFEYLIISRNYSIGTLLLFCSIAFYPRINAKYQLLYIALLLGLCLNTNIYALIIACCLFAYFTFLLVVKDKKDFYKIGSLFVPIIIFIVFFIIALLQIIPPKDRTPKIAIATKVSLNKVFKVSNEVSEALFYMPDVKLRERYWGSNIFKANYFSKPIFNAILRSLPIILTLALIISLISTFIRSPAILFFFTASFISLLSFMFLVFNKGLLRHSGAFFVLLVTALWLYYHVAPESRTKSRVTNALLIIMLIIQFAGSAIAHVNEIRSPFSGAKDAALFLVKISKTGDKVLIHPDFQGMALLHYAGIKEAFYPTIAQTGSFIKFNDQRKARSFDEIYSMVLKEHITIMVFNGPRSDTMIEKLGFKLLYHTPQPSAVADEDFYIYGKKERLLLDTLMYKVDTKL